MSDIRYRGLRVEQAGGGGSQILVGDDYVLTGDVPPAELVRVTIRASGLQNVAPSERENLLLQLLICGEYSMVAHA